MRDESALPKAIGDAEGWPALGEAAGFLLGLILVSPRSPPEGWLLHAPRLPPAVPRKVSRGCCLHESAGPTGTVGTRPRDDG